MTCATGGGATLELLSGVDLPGVEAIGLKSASSMESKETDEVVERNDLASLAASTNLEGMKCFVRVDFNVPLDKEVG